MIRPSTMLLLVSCWGCRPATPPPIADLARPPSMEEARTREALKHLTDGPFGHGEGFSQLVELGPKAFPILARLIRERATWDSDELAIIAEAMGATKSPDAEDVLLAILERNRSCETEVLLALADSRSPSALPRLRAALGRPSADLKTAAIDGMGRLGDPAAIPDLLAVITGSDGPAASLARANADPNPGTLHELAAGAIDRITGQKLNGNPVRIRRWLEHHRQLK